MSSEAELTETPVDNIPGLVDQVRQGWRTHRLWSERQKKEFTLRQLKNFKKMIDENVRAICQAVKADINKCKEETIMTEINLVIHDIIAMIRDFDDITKPRPVKKGIVNMFDDLHVKPEPYGVVLILGAWNYPVSLLCQPMVGAIAAGNAMVVKPSELSVNTSNVFADLIPKYLDQNYYKVITGGVPVGQAVIKQRFDYIFYTGSTKIGKLVMAEASKNLTPVTLELGGKSPVIVADDANLKIAAKRIMWGKLVNSGQTCIAPDYVLLTSPTLKDKFVDYCKSNVKSFFGEDPSKAKDYGRIVNRRHFDRITKLMSSSNGNNVMSGDTNADDRYIAPAIFVDVEEDDALLQEELFGPVLPILTVDGLDEAIQFVNERERPLAFYIFTESKANFDKVASSTSSGAMVQNNTILYFGVPTLPFGGVSNSGMGAYHGHFTFETFSHMKPVFRSGTKLDFLLDVVYPPYNKSKLAQANFVQIPSTRRWSIFKPLFLLVFFALVAIAIQLHVNVPLPYFF